MGVDSADGSITRGLQRTRQGVRASTFTSSGGPELQASRCPQPWEEGVHANLALGPHPPPHPRPCLHLSKCGSALRHGRWGGLAGFEVSPRTVESVLGARPVVPPPLLKGSGCRGRDTTPAQLVAPQYHLGVTQGTALRPSAPLSFCHGCA